MTLRLHQGRYAVCRFDPAESWMPRGEFWSMTKTADELSVVCEESAAKGETDLGWRMLEVEGPLPFHLTGVLSSIAAPLAAAGVSLFAVSTFDTDYVLVKQDVLAAALRALREAGHLCEDVADDGAVDIR